MTGPNIEDYSSPARRRAAIIVNPVKVDVTRLRSAVAVEEEKNGWLSSVWFETTVDDPGQHVARTALGHDPAVVIIAGGDGTIRAVTEGLQTTQVPVAVVAAGTGNLFARNLHLVADIETSVHTAFAGTNRTIDVGVANFTNAGNPAATHVFLVMTGVGLDAKMATDTSSTLKKHIGWLAYADPISKSVIANEQFTLHYRVDDGQERSVLAHTVIVGNCGTLAGGILLLPNAKIDDGLLDVVLLRPKGLWQWLRVAFRLGIGGILHRSKRGQVVLRAAPDFRALQYAQAHKLVARFDQPQVIQLDGDGFGMVTAVTITLRPDSLNIRVPK